MVFGIEGFVNGDLFSGAEDSGNGEPTALDS